MEVSTALNSIQPSYIREILKAGASQNIISLAGGLPDEKLFPLHLIGQSLSEIINIPELFQYGLTEGYRPLLDFLRTKYEIASDQGMLMTTGSQQGLDLIARTLINPGDSIVVEAPSYLGALQIFTLAQARIHAVEQVDDGPNLNNLEQIFSENNVKLFYSVPDFHNPTGVCWSLEKRKYVAELCENYNVLLVEDIPYREIRFSGEELPIVSSFCPDHSVSLRSFSKICTPGMRIGFISFPIKFSNSLEKIKQIADLHSSVPMQYVLLETLRHSEFPVHLDKLRSTYKRKYDCMVNSLNQFMPISCRFTEVSGGMFIWLKIPSASAVDVARKALKEGIGVVPGDVFYTPGHSSEQALRLNFTNCSEADIQLAIQKLSSVI